MARQPHWVTFIGLAAYAATPPPPLMAALDPAVRLSQSAHTAWRVRDGFLGSAPHAVSQTTDGYLWIGTDAGLLRFDGVRFVPWAPPRDTPLPSSAIISLLGARDGSLWIGTAAGVAHWTNGRLDVFPNVVGRVNAILEDDDGSIWIARARIAAAVQGPQGPLCRFHQGALRCYGAAEGMACRVGTTLAKDASGAIWLGGSEALCRWKAGQTTNYLQRELAPIQGTPGISSLAAGTEGGLWVGTYISGAALGLRRFVDGSSVPYALPGMDGGALKVSALQTDTNGSLWIGTADEGLYRLAGGRAEHFRSADGLSSDTVIRFYQDREGSLWVVTSKGIDRLRDYRVITHSAREGLTGDDVNSVLATADGTVWAGNLGALNALRGSTVSSIALSQGLPGVNVTSLFEDRQGRMWVGVDNSLFAYEGGRFRPVKTRHGGPLGIVLAMTDDSDHNLWAEVAGARPGLVRIRNLEEIDYVPLSAIPWVSAMAPDPHDGIWLGLLDGNLGRYRRGRLETLSSGRPTPGRIRGLVVEPEGAVWTASPGGLTRWQGGVPRTLDSRHGLPCNDVFALIRDDHRALWLYSACGLVVIAGSELDRWSAGSSDVIETKTFDVLDGAQPALSTFQPAAAMSRDGRLWFANSSFLQSIDPGHLARDSRPPAVHVEQLVADQRTYGAGSILQLPPLTREIQVDYSATGLVMPEKARFRYKLEGRDADWQDPGTRRQAFYNDLPPGAYRFRVRASNHDGIWNESGATLDFVVAPAYYQTVWFRAGIAATAIAVLWILYRLRLRQLTAAAEARLETRLAERTRIAQDLHDTLLQGFLSASMQLHVAADQIPADSPGKARLGGVLDLMSRVIHEGRNAVRGLRAPESGSGDLEESFSRIRQELGIQDEIAFRVVGEGPPRALNPMIRDDVLRIGREAVVNAFRHSAGRRIDVAVERGRDVLRVRVLDDGRGMDHEILRAGRDGHWGLSGMRERAEQMGGTLRVWSRPGAGTEVELSVPGHVAYPNVPSRGALEWLRSLPRRWSKRIP
jgi:signal transduction histidine kinase/ligand-binding sensor domain-containing protein